MKSDREQRYRPVPTNQIDRFFKIGTMSAGIIGNMVISASSNLMIGRRQNVKELLLTKKNMERFVYQISNLRGAALKLGQLISLEGGDVVPEPIQKILTEFRNDAYRMPPTQLRNVLEKVWGENFLTQFNRFDVNPIAAASIGQVHKCETVNQKILAIKVQYPGISESINSDIKNIGFLLRNSGLIPDTLLLDRLLEEAKSQLYEEVDYLAESRNLLKFYSLFENSPFFEVPRVDKELTTQKTLAMEFKSGIIIDELVNFDEDTRNRIISRLIKLIFMEIFEFNLIQTDPNFANFLYNSKTDKIILLDFGATRTLDSNTVNSFKMLLTSILNQNTEEIRENLNKLGLITDDLSSKVTNSILKLISRCSLPIINGEHYDFADPHLFREIKIISKQLIENKTEISVPPITTLLIQRKIGGIFLLARRFKARVDLNKIILSYL